MRYFAVLLLVQAPVLLGIVGYFADQSLILFIALGTLGGAMNFTVTLLLATKLRHLTSLEW